MHYHEEFLFDFVCKTNSFIYSRSLSKLYEWVYGGQKSSLKKLSCILTDFTSAIYSLEGEDEERFSTVSKELFGETLDLILAMRNKEQELEEVVVADVLETFFVTLEKNGIHPIDENQTKEEFPDDYNKSVMANATKIKQNNWQFLTAWCLRTGDESFLIMEPAFGRK